MANGTWNVVLGAVLIAWGVLAGLASLSSGYAWSGLILIGLGVWSLLVGLSKRAAYARSSAQRK